MNSKKSTKQKFQKTSFKTHKKEGSILVVTLLLAGLVLMLGLSAANLLARELNFSTDVLFTERAYYGAESGVETSLVSLNEDPVQHIDPQTEKIDLPGLSDDVDVSFYAINNQVKGSESEKFEFELDSFDAQKFRFNYDTDPSDGPVARQTSGNFSLKITPSSKFQWRFICPLQSGTGTYALVGEETSGLKNSFLNAVNGIVEDVTPEAAPLTPTNFNAWTQVCTEWFYPPTGGGIGHCNASANINQDKCFFSIQNLSPDAAAYEVTPMGSSVMSPHLSEVTSRATAGDRTKLIQFDYLQKNLGSLFDFSFYHND